MRLVIDLQGSQSPGSRHRGIGRYSLNLARAMVRQAGDRDFWLLLNQSFGESVDTLRAEFQEWIPRDKIRTFEIPGFSKSGFHNDLEGVRVAELLRESFLADLKPDAVLITSHFEGFADAMTSSVGSFEPSIKTAVILHDLIPLIHRERCLVSPQSRYWYLRRLDDLRKANLLLSNSESSRREAIEHLSYVPERVVNISCDTSDIFRPISLSNKERIELLNRYGISGPFLLQVGGIDFHKNFDRLVTAFGMLPRSCLATYKLVVVGPKSADIEERLVRLCEPTGLKRESIVITGFVPDEDLNALYNCCHLFVFPSIHEGFGIPVLEAMRTGAAALAGNTTSLPEVVGRSDALFDPTSTVSMSRKISEVLTNEKFRQELRAHGLIQAQKFSWEATAKRAWSALEELIFSKAVSTNNAVIQAKPSLAYLTGDPLATQAADFSDKLLPALSAFYKITIVSNQPPENNAPAQGNFPHQAVDWFKAHARDFDRVLYDVGSSPSHRQLLDLLQEYPGTVILHDFFLGGVYLGDHEGHRVQDIAAVLYQSHGYRPLVAADLGKLEACAQSYPNILPILKQAVGVIVYDPSYVDLAASWYGIEPDQFRLISAPDGSFLTDSTGERYRDALETFWRESPVLRQMRLVEAVTTPSLHERSDLVETAVCIQKNRRRLGPRQLLLAVSRIRGSDTHTGIERVTRAVTLQLIESVPQNMRVEPVYMEEGRYFYARQFTSERILRVDTGLEDDLVEVHPGDIFLGLDWNPDDTTAHESLFVDWRRRGIRIYFQVCDILPTLKPLFFDEAMRQSFSRWLDFILQVSDGIVCISRTVAEEVREWHKDHPSGRTGPLRLGWYHQGANLLASVSTTDLPAEAAGVLEMVKMRSSFLMVGTVEPRKGYPQALAACELLWSEGCDFNLIIVGRPGWMQDDFVAKLNRHPEKGRRLHWLTGVSDEYVDRLYESCSCLIAASEGEGFGLPLIEAARHQLPILARDLPVFQEIAGKNAAYFTGLTAQELADALKDWIKAAGQKQTISSGKIPWLTWKESVSRLFAFLIEAKDADIVK